MMPSVETSVVAKALFGDLVDVEKMGPDPSGVHVPGLTAVRIKRKRPVEKALLSKLRIGRLKSLKASLSDPAAFASMKQAAHSANQTAAAAGKQRVVGAPIAGQVNSMTTGAAHNVQGAIAQGAKDRDHLSGLLGSTTGKVATAGVLSTAYLAGKRRGTAQAGYDVYKFDDRRKRQVTAGLSATGAAAGAYGLGYAANKIRRTGWKAAPRSMKIMLPLEAAGLGGEVMATQILHGDTKRDKQQPVAKVDDVTFGGAFSKFDNDKKQAFGWASVVELNGEPVVDRQGDYIGIDDIEEAAYAYIRKSRVAGDMHRRTTGPDGEDTPFKAGEVIESVVFTKDKCQAMSLPMACAGKWWIGVQVDDDSTWAEVKKQARTGFSIHGRGLRKDTSLDEIRGC